MEILEDALTLDTIDKTIDFLKETEVIDNNQFVSLKDALVEVGKQAEQTAYLMRALFRDFCNFVCDFNEAYKTCPNRRVAHLMKYGKGYKIRYKNYIRALKIIQKETNNG